MITNKSPKKAQNFESNPESSLGLNALLAGYRATNARALNRLRAAGSLVWIFLMLLIPFATRGDFLKYMVVVGAYAALSNLLFFWSRHSDEKKRWTLYAIPLLDLPLIFLAQRSVIYGTIVEYRMATSTFSAAVFSILIFWAVLALDNRVTVITGVVAITLECVLLDIGGMGQAPAFVSVGLVLGLITCVAVLNERLLNRLFKNIVSSQEAIAKGEIEKASLKKDMELTGAVQTLLLPQQQDSSSNYFETAAFYRSSAQSGGDWWWREEGADGSTLVILGDVTGHGPASAMVAASAASSYWTLKSLRDGRQGDSVARITEELNQLNLHLAESFRGAYYMTLAAFYLDPVQKNLTYWSAGAPPALLMDPQGKVVALDSGGNPLGMGTQSIEPKSHSLVSQQRLMVFTDGIVDAAQAGRSTLGLKGLARNLGHTHGKVIATARNDLAAPVSSSDEVLKDDVTFVLVDVLSI